MLAITRSGGQRVVLFSESGERIEIELVFVRANKARLSFTTDNKYRIIRGELLDALGGDIDKFNKGLIERYKERGVA